MFVRTLFNDDFTLFGEMGYRYDDVFNILGEFSRSTGGSVASSSHCHCLIERWQSTQSCLPTSQKADVQRRSDRRTIGGRTPAARTSVSTAMLDLMRRGTSVPHIGIDAESGVFRHCIRQQTLQFAHCGENALRIPHRDFTVDVHLNLTRDFHRILTHPCYA